MALIKSIQEVKAVLRISAVDSESSLPDIEAAEQAYIIPCIGKALYDELVAAYNDNTLSPAQSALVFKIQKPLAAFAYHDDLALQHAMITDAGVRRTTTDNMPSAFRWEFDGVKKALLNKAYQGMEALMEWLELYKAEFPAYTSSDAYARANKLLIKRAVDFRDQYLIAQPYRTYAALVPIMFDVEELYVSRMIGPAFFAAIKADATPTTQEKEFLALLKKAIAHLTLHHAFEKYTVQITDAGATILDKAGAEADQAQPSAQHIEFTMRALLRDGQTYLTRAKKYLDTNASGTVFADYFNSEYYTAPVAEKKDLNDGRKTFSFIR